MDEDAATEKAISDFGDATVIGIQLDRTHRPKPQWTMLAATAALLVIGFLAQLIVLDGSGSFEILSTRFIYMVIGIAVMFAAYFMDFTLLGRFPKTVYFLILILAIIFSNFTYTINGVFYVPAYLPILFPLSFAVIVYAARNKGYIGIILCGLAFIPTAYIALNIPSISGFLIYAVSGIAILIVAIKKDWFKVKKRNAYILLFIPILIVCVLFFTFVAMKYWYRFTTIFNPSLDPDGIGYFSTMTRELLGGAKLIGMGNIPEQYADYFSNPAGIMRSEYILTFSTVYIGWIAFTLILFALLYFIIKGFKLCLRQKNSLGLFVSLSVMITFALQTIGAVTCNLGMQVLSSPSLPLISFGNMEMVINLGLIGFMLSVFRTGDIVRDDSKFLEKVKF